MKKYYIKDEYVPNRGAITLDEASDGQYWNKSSIRSSFYYQFPVYQYAKELIQKKDVKKVIDVGCGTAAKLVLIHDVLPEVDFVGIDQKGAIDYCRNAYSFGNWYVDNIEMPDRSLENIKGELVICSDVIEHLQDPDHLLDYLKGKVVEDGHILLSTPERDILRGKSCTSSPNRFHVREWNYTELEAYLSFSGFRILEHFLGYSFRFGINRITFNAIARRIISGKSLKYNQVCLLQVK